MLVPRFDEKYICPLRACVRAIRRERDQKSRTVEYPPAEDPPGSTRLTGLTWKRYNGRAALTMPRSEKIPADIRYYAGTRKFPALAISMPQ